MTQQEKLKKLRDMKNPEMAMLMEVFSVMMNNVEKIKGDKGDSPTKEELLGLIEPLIPPPQKGDKGDSPTQEELVSIIKPLIPDPIPGKKGDKGDNGHTPTQEELRALIKPLIPPPIPGKDADPVELEKLVEETVKALMDTQEWKDMETKIKYNKYDQRWHGGGSGESVLIADLTSQCDGATKSFVVPSHTRAIKLEGTQFPIIYRPTSDWTTSGTSLTLDAGVGAPEAGQTLLFYYVA